MKKVLLALLLCVSFFPEISSATPNPNRIDMATVTVPAYMAQVVVVSGNNTYVCSADPGTPTSSATWQCQDIYVSGSTTTITWANGSAEYKNVATSPSTLTYS